MIKSRILPLQIMIRQGYNTGCNVRSKGVMMTTDSTNVEKEKELARIVKEASIDSPPQACCRSGCANCVYIAWAEAITSQMKEAGPEVSAKILKMVDDPSLRAYLEMELRIRGFMK